MSLASTLEPGIITMEAMTRACDICQLYLMNERLLISNFELLDT